jgi:hypothetical protein
VDGPERWNRGVTEQRVIAEPERDTVPKKKWSRQSPGREVEENGDA